MTLFTNPNFIDHIVRSQGAINKISKDHYCSLQTLIELQVRRAIESAIKLMLRDRRDKLEAEDIEFAVRQIGHRQLKILTPQSTYHKRDEHIIREDKIFSTPEEVFQSQIQLLQHANLEQPKLRGRWIFIKNKVPKTNDNKNVKSLSELLANKQYQNQQRSKVMNVIKDEPYSLLTKQQADYFYKVTNLVQNNLRPQKFVIEGNINSLFPFFLNYLGKTQMNDTAIVFLLSLLQNKYIWIAVEYYLMKVISLLLAYKGLKSFSVGLKIAQLVNRFDDKYPVLRDIFENYEDQSYSTVLKKICFELELGIPFKMKKNWLEKCYEDMSYSDPMASLCMNTLMTFMGQLKHFRQEFEQKNGTFVYWHPNSILKNDSYLQSL